MDISSGPIFVIFSGYGSIIVREVLNLRKIMVSLLLLIEQWARSYGVWLGEQARSHTP